jgi:hypothetical protein
MFLVGLFVCAVAGMVAAQTGPSTCPTITVEGPGLVPPGNPMVFTADVKGGPYAIKGYEWSISAGTIASGQGTRSITVDPTGLAPSSNVTATVIVKGGSIACPNSASETGGIAPSIQDDTVDIYGKTKWPNEKARLDNAWIQLRQSPDYRLYISLRAEKGDSFDDARDHARKMIDHIIWRDKKFDASRIIFAINVNDVDDFTRYWFVPPGAELPECKDGCIQILGSDLVKK